MPVISGCYLNRKLRNNSPTYLGVSEVLIVRGNIFRASEPLLAYVIEWNRECFVFKWLVGRVVSVTGEQFVRQLIRFVRKLLLD